MTAMLDTTIAAATLASLALNGWHHAGWPVAMKLANRRPPPPAPPPVSTLDAPHLTVVMPAYNEAQYIAVKLRNLAELDYPADRLHVVVACDGCTDGTAAIARQTLAEPGCAHLQAVVADHERNRGKVALLNATIAAVQTEIVVLTDISAILACDSLRRIAAHFADPRLGAVGGTYRLMQAGSEGEAGYWRYQIAVKRGEAAMGAPLGLHGAMYAIRRSAWAPLPPDTINDDFILPLEIFGRGWRVAYDETIVAWEAEVASNAQDRHRRRRIAAGNAQQLVRLAWLLHPRFGLVALSFASGKALRVIAPFLFGLSLAGSLILAGSALFAALAALQLAAVLLAVAGAFAGENAPRPLALARYAAAGHLASAIGVVRYCAGIRQPQRAAVSFPQIAK